MYRPHPEPRTPWQQGFDAYNQGLRLSANPYHHRGDNENLRWCSQQWILGFKSARILPHLKTAGVAVVRKWGKDRVRSDSGYYIPAALLRNSRAPQTR